MQIEGISAEVRLIRSSRRSLAAEIMPDGTVILRAPQRMPEQEIRRFVTEKSADIERHVQKRRAQHDQIAALPPFTAQDIRGMARRAAEVIPQRVAYFAQKIGVTYGRITIRNQKTRWGSCTAEGNLNFNCLLIEAPPEVLDSVVVHELCHRLHANHSKDFYAAVYRAFPDYERCSKWLRDNGGMLIGRMEAGLGAGQ